MARLWDLRTSIRAAFSSSFKSFAMMTGNLSKNNFFVERLVMVLYLELLRGKYVPLRVIISWSVNFGEVGSSSKARKESASSKRRKSLSPNGVKVGEEVETIGSYLSRFVPRSWFQIDNVMALCQQGRVISPSYYIDYCLRLVFMKLLSRIRGLEGSGLKIDDYENLQGYWKLSPSHRRLQRYRLVQRLNGLEALTRVFAGQRFEYGKTKGKPEA
ncbi:hypothetical protein Tco_1468434 [Tanacetum coccineum]